MAKDLNKSSNISYNCAWGIIAGTLKPCNSFPGRKYSSRQIPLFVHLLNVSREPEGRGNIS
jgi:hypothetical protein